MSFTMKSAAKRSATVLAICFAALILVAVAGSNVYADSYTAPPEDLQFNKTYNMDTPRDGKWRYDFHVSKSGAFKLDRYLESDENYDNVTIFLFNDAGVRQCYFDIDSNEYYSTSTVYLSSGDYYIIVDSYYGNSDNAKLTFNASFGNAKGTSIRRLRRSKGRTITATIKKLTIADSLQMQVSRNRKFKRGVKTYTEEQWGNDYITSWRTGRLKRGKYYVRVRALYDSTDEKTVRSPWSKVKSIRVR